MYKLKKISWKKAVAYALVLAMVCVASSGLIALATEDEPNAWLAELLEGTGVLTMENGSTQKDEEWSGETPFSDKLAEGVEKAAENDNFTLYYNPKTLAIQVVEKATGYVHSSIVEEGDKVDGLNKTWTGMMQSGITLELRDTKGKVSTWPLTTKEATVESTILGSGFTATVTWPEGIVVKVDVKLTEQGLDIAVPKDGISEDENSEYTLQSIYLFPFMDANRGHDQNGYMFVPDGCGALIRTSVETLSTEPYRKQVYGSDIGLGKFTGRQEQAMLIPAENVYIPVYGMIQNIDKSGLAAIITSGDEYAQIEAYACGITTDFNFITAKFMVREVYQMKMSQSGTSVPKTQKERNQFDIGISYTFLSGKNANYIGIADTYRDYLIEKNVFAIEESKGTDIPLKLEFVVSEQKDGLVGTSTVSMTTVDEVDEILSDLMEEGITNIEVVLRGVSKEGASGVAPTVFNFNNKTGSKKEWTKLIGKYAEKGVNVSFYCDFTRGYEGADGFSNKDKAQSISKIMLTTYDNGLFTYLSPRFTVNALKEFADDAQSIGMNSLAVDCLGRYLYSNWNNKNMLSRGEAKALFEGMEMKDATLNLYTPNAYLFAQTDAIYDVPTSSSGYYIFTDTIPFLQILLKGYIPMYGSGFNFHANAQADLLTCMEYGIYPSFYLTKEETIELLDTDSSWLYTSEYALWKDSILEEYTKLNDALSKVEGATIVDRVVLATNVVRVDYSNGTSLVINHSDAVYSENGISVDANHYMLVESGD